MRNVFFSLVAVLAGGLSLSTDARPAVSAASAATPAPHRATVVTVTTRDYAFDAPDTIPAGRTTIRLVNKGPDFHHVWLVQLQGGRTLADLAAAMQKGEGPMPAWTTDVGGPNSPMPGGESIATLDLAPGRYAMLCVIPAMKDGVPHVMKGMMKEITVAPATGARFVSREVSAPDVVMTLGDYDFRFSRPIAAGSRTIRITNAAAQSHEAVIIRLTGGATAQSFLAAMSKPGTPPPGEIVGGVTPIARGRWIDLTATFTPGEYALLCFAPDAKDGKPHIEHGMVTQFRVQ